MTAKLTYFNIPGLGEPVRFMLSAANIPFEDIRVSKEEWEVMKPKLKWPHLPMLEMDGKILFQSMAICRHLARQVDLAGSNEDEVLLADMTVGALEDMRLRVILFYFTEDSPSREKNMKQAAEVIVPLYMKNLEEQVEENEGHLVCGKTTWADIIFTCHADYMSHILQQDVLAKSPKLKALLEKTKQLPGLKRYIESRPEIPADLRVAY